MSKNKKFKFHIGFKVFMYYILFTYFMQIIFMNMFYDDFATKYNGMSFPTILTIFFIFIFIFITICIDVIIPKVKQIKLSKNIVKFLKILSWIIVFLFLISSIDFYTYYSLSFRHTIRLREASWLIKILFVLDPFILMIVFFKLSFFVKNHFLNTLDKAQLTLILISLVASLKGSLGIVLIFITIILLLKPRIFIEPIGKKQIFGYGIILIVMISLVIIIGYSKGNTSLIVKSFSNLDLIKSFFISIFLRISSSFVSLQVMLESHVFDFNLQFNTILNAWYVFEEKILILFSNYDKNAQNEVLQTVHRVNYLLYEKDISLPRAGASPGLFASIFYIPLFPFNVLFISFFTLALIRATNRYFYQVKYNIITILAVLYFLHLFFSSPLSLLYIVEPMNLSIMLYYIGSFVKNTK